MGAYRGQVVKCMWRQLWTCQAPSLITTTVKSKITIDHLDWGRPVIVHGLSPWFLVQEATVAQSAAAKHDIESCLILPTWILVSELQQSHAERQAGPEGNACVNEETKKTQSQESREKQLELRQMGCAQGPQTLVWWRPSEQWVLLERFFQESPSHTI